MEVSDDSIKRRLVIMCIIKTIVAVLSLLMLYFAQKNLNYFTNSFHGFIQNWNNNLISSISPNGLSSSLEYGGNWGGAYPGTVEGCDCYVSSSKSGVSAGLHRHTCSTNETRYGCSTVHSIPKTPFTYWNKLEKVNVSFYFQSSFNQLHKNMETNGNCKTGFKKCGNPSSISTGICVPNEWPSCPITDIYIGPSNPNPNYYTESAAYSTYAVFASRSSEANPVADLQVGEYRMCENPKTWGITPGRKEYELYEGYTSDCVPDSRYTTLDSIDEISLFEANSIPFRSLPRFSPSSLYRWTRFTRRIIDWKPECLPEVPKLNEVTGHMSTTRTICLTMTIISFITIIVCWLIQIFETANAFKYGVDREKLFWGARLKTLISCITIPFLVIIVIRAKPLNDYFTEVHSMRCSDSFTNDYFGRMQTSIHRDVFLFNLGSLIVGLMTLGLDVAEVIFFRLKSRIVAAMIAEAQMEIQPNNHLL